MKRNGYNVIRLLALTVPVLLISRVSSYAQLDLKQVYPVYGQNTMTLLWTSVPGAQEYQYQRRVDAGTFDTVWHSAGLATTITDPNTVTAFNMYYYRVRVKVGGVWADTSNIRKNKMAKIWPVYKQSDCSTELPELLHGFGQPIGVDTDDPPDGIANLRYFHEGIDLQGESGAANECIKAPAGGVIIHSGGYTNGGEYNYYVNIRVNINGVNKYISFNHIDTISPDMDVLTTVAPGDTIGFMRPNLWSPNTLTNHTHCHYSPNSGFSVGTMNPLTFWDDNAYRDPQNKKPKIKDTNGDGQALRFKKGTGAYAYFPDDGKVYNKVDIVAECQDEQSSDAPFQNMIKIGYFIEKHNGSAWVNAVKSSGTPYRVLDHNIFYNSGAGSPNTALVGQAVDYSDTKKATEPAGYAFDQWYNYIVTNTKGLGGAIADIDSNQCWATNARSTVGTDNGFTAGYDSARVIDEAKFKDGRYRVNILTEDFVNTGDVYQEEVRIDNFRPYVKKMEIVSGDLNYSAQWTWNNGAGQLDFQPYTGNKKACGKIKVKVTMSEPMKEVLIGIPSLSFNAVATVVAGTDSTVWECEVPKEKTKNAPEGPHKIEVGGIDKADNQVHGFTTKDPVPAASIPKRLINGNWTVNPASNKDKVHEFKINKLDSLLKFTSVKDPKCKGSADGEITVSVTGGNPPFTYEWTPSGGNGPTATGLKAGTYKVTVTDVNGCSGTKDTFITDPPGLNVGISGGGISFYRMCDPPAPVTLTASASGGKAPYTYNWPGGTLTVSSSGFYTATVTDKNNCTKSSTVFVLFIPIICSRDPNDIVGPPGYGDGHYVSVNDVLPYTIRFENDPDFATAPAQNVKITHPLDDNVNLFSLRLGDFGFGDFVFKVPANRTSYSARLDVKDSLGVYVDVVAGIDVNKKEAFWIFESKDPTTGLEPGDPNLGFLLVNDSLHHGEGFVSYTIKPKNTSKTGDTIHAEAEIVFDINDPIKTPAIFNIIDAVAPVSEVADLPAVTNKDTFTVAWSGADDSLGSGIGEISLYVATNDGPFTFFQSYGPDSVTSILYTGQQGNTYHFYTLASDNTDNKEVLKTSPEASITLGTLSVLNPQANTAFCTGDTLYISWNSTGIDSLDIQYSADSGATWHAVTNGVTDSPGEYKWLLPDSLYEGSEYFIRLSAGFFTEKSAQFTVHSVDVLAITPGGSTELCQGDSVILTADPGFQSYSWSNGAMTQSIAAKQTGTYAVTVFDMNGCTASRSIDVLVNPLPVIDAGADAQICEGDTVQIGLAPRPGIFAWTPSAGLSSTSVSKPSAFPSSTTMYYITYTDTNGCKALDSVKVTVIQNPTPAITSSGTFEFCKGDSVTLDAGAGYNSYSWSTGAVSQTIVVKATGSFSVTVTNAQACVGTSPVKQVTVYDIQPASITANGPLEFCKGDSVTLDAGSGYDAYSWSTGAATRTIVAKASGNYTVTVTDTNGCDASASKSVTVNELPVIDLGTDKAICKGDSMQLNAGNQSGTYQWNPASGLSDADISDPKASPAASTVYYLNFTDTNGCSTIDSILVTVNPKPQPVVTASGPLTFCEGDSVTLAADSGYTDYLWSNGTMTQSTTVYAGGSYTVTVTNQYNCSATSSATVITEVVVAKPDISANDSVDFCEGDSLTLDAGSGYDEYLWSNGDTTQTTKVKQNGSYYVTVSLDPGCSVNSDTLVVTVHPDPPIPVITQNVDTLISSAAAAYQWNKDGVPIAGANNQTYVPTAAGDYTVTITDANGCKSTSAIVVITGIFFGETGNYLKVYPNPTNGVFIIKGNFSQAQQLRYEITNIVGATILSVDEGLIQGGYEKEIDIRKLSPAIYLLTFKGEKKDMVIRIIKQ